MKRSYEIDMCSGPLLPKILLFSVPLMLSGILQLLFNAADIIVVGQFTGSQAMAAVGSTGSLNNLIINIFLGFSIGSSVLMARYYGAKEDGNIKELVHTSVLLAIISGCFLIVIGIILARPLLSLMGTPDDVIDQAVLYMRIVFLGMPALITYDFGAGILRAIGDTRRPPSSCLSFHSWYHQCLSQSFLCHRIRPWCGRSCPCDNHLPIHICNSCIKMHDEKR